MKRVLFSPGYGAGWSSWNISLPAEALRLMTEYEPIIEAILKGHELEDDDPLILRMVEEIRDICGKDELGNERHICTLGASSLRVTEVPDGDRYRIEEYDGYESVIIESEESKRHDWF